MLTQRVVAFALAAGILSWANMGALAQKKTAPKAPQKKIGTIGTAQMPGENCELGKAYSLGGPVKINLTLNSAEFTTRRIDIGKTERFLADGSQKTLVLRYTLQNPNPTEQAVSWNSIKWTAVSETNVNFENVPYAGAQLTNETLNSTLKPGQRIDAYTVILVPAKGQVPKLIAQVGTNVPVARYNLVGQVKPLAKEVADPADKSGSSVLDVVPLKLGDLIEGPYVDIKVDKVEMLDQPLYPFENLDGKRLVVFTVTAKMVSPTSSANFAGLAIYVVTGDGDKLTWNNGYVTHGKRNEAAPNVPADGSEITVRLALQLAKGDTLKSFTLKQEPKGRLYSFPGVEAK